MFGYRANLVGSSQSDACDGAGELVDCPSPRLVEERHLTQLHQRFGGAAHIADLFLVTVGRSLGSELPRQAGPRMTSALPDVSLLPAPNSITSFSSVSLLYVWNDAHRSRKTARHNGRQSDQRPGSGMEPDQCWSKMVAS
jgi:hypothetical protein